MKKFEVLWYTMESADTNYGTTMTFEESHTMEFSTRKQALAFYEAHKNDEGCYGWWVTHRNADWEVIEDLVY